MDIFSHALNIFIDLNQKFIDIVFLSLYVSLLATIIATIISIYVYSKHNDSVTCRNVLWGQFVICDNQIASIVLISVKFHTNL